MEIKHTHPSHASAEKRAERLKNVHRTCLARIGAVRSAQTQREMSGRRT